MKASSSEALDRTSTAVAGKANGVAAEQSKGGPLLSINSAIFKDVRVALDAKLGSATLSVEKLLALRAGSILPLDTAMNDLIELSLNQSVVARGEIVAVGDYFAIRIVEIAPIS